MPGGGAWRLFGGSGSAWRHVHGKPLGLTRDRVMHILAQQCWQCMHARMHAARMKPNACNAIGTHAMHCGGTAARPSLIARRVVTAHAAGGMLVAAQRSCPTDEALCPCIITNATNLDWCCEASPLKPPQVPCSPGARGAQTAPQTCEGGRAAAAWRGMSAHTGVDHAAGQQTIAPPPPVLPPLQASVPRVRTLGSEPSPPWRLPDQWRLPACRPARGGPRLPRPTRLAPLAGAGHSLCCPASCVGVVGVSA